MVYIRRFIGIAAALSTLNLAVALPQPGGDLSQQSGYGSSSQDSKSSNNYGSNSGYDSSKDSNKGSNNSGYDSSKGSNNSGYDSSKGSNNSGYDSSKGSNNSGYDSSKSSSNNGYSSDKTTSSSKMEETKTSTSSSMMETSTSSMMSESTSTSTTMFESTSTMMSESSTETAAASSTSVMYGSGSVNSGSNSYNDCVAQCIASFSPSSTASSVNSGSSGSSDSAGTGATKTVIVAPTKGVFRYVPFAVNATVGDTIKFVWKAGPHTVTKGSALQPCNATSDAPFSSQQQDVGFEFTQEVTSTDPTFFFCGVPSHCQKGMFGIINPSSNLNAPTSASGMMQSLKANNADLKAYAAITDTATSGKPAALWGGSIELSSLPDWAQPLAAQSILYTRNFLASNPEVLKDDGTIDMSNADTTPLMYPLDVADALNAATSTPSNSSAPSANAAGATTTSATSASGPAPTSGAGLTTPRAVLALVAVAATVLML